METTTGATTAGETAAGETRIEDLNDAEKAVLARYHEKCLSAGGPRPGYVLRLKSLVPVQRAGSGGGDLASTLESLIARGLLVTNESAQRYYLTEPGAGLLERNPARFG